MYTTWLSDKPLCVQTAHAGFFLSFCQLVKNLSACEHLTPTDRSHLDKTTVIQISQRHVNGDKVRCPTSQEKQIMSYAVNAYLSTASLQKNK